VANLLPGGRPAHDPAARAEVAAAWGVPDLPDHPGRDTTGILAAARDGDIAALVVGGVEIDDLPDPQLADDAFAAAEFVVSLEVRRSAVTEVADVVLPVAPVAEKPGTFLDWEGRPRPFAAALRDTASMPDQRVLDALAEAMGARLGLPDAAAARTELGELGTWHGEVPGSPTASAAPTRSPGPGEAVLAAWRMLLDCGRMQDGEPQLAGTARRPVVRLSAATAAEIDAGDGDLVTVSTHRGAITLPLAVTDLPDRVVWLPLNSPGSQVHRHLAATAGDVVGIQLYERRADGGATDGTVTDGEAHR
jgi:NADH-quinone oxidoreductase subunit G